MPYGYRLWMEGRSASVYKDRLNSTYAITNLLTDVVAKAGMRLAAGPFTYQEPPRHTGKGPGVTGIAVLIESSVHVHTYPEKDFYFFELFSCNQFDYHAIIAAVCEFMGLGDCETEYVPVGESFPLEDDDDDDDGA